MNCDDNLALLLWLRRKRKKQEQVNRRTAR